MMSLSDTIAWLRRLAVVSCPDITSQQAAEVAELLTEQQRQVDGFRKATAERYAEVVEAVHEHDITKTELEASRTLAAKLYADLGIRTQERDAAIKERDYYKKAKAENDDRFMFERDEARELAANHKSECIITARERDALQVEIDRLKGEMKMLNERVRDARDKGAFAPGYPATEGRHQHCRHEVHALRHLHGFRRSLLGVQGEGRQVSLHRKVTIWVEEPSRGAYSLRIYAEDYVTLTLYGDKALERRSVLLAEMKAAMERAGFDVAVEVDE